MGLFGQPTILPGGMILGEGTTGIPPIGAAQTPNPNAGPGAAGVTYNPSTQQPDFTATVVVPNADQLRPTNMTASGGSARGIKYTVQTRTYPVSVSGDKDLQHYMCFFINICSDRFLLALCA